MRSTSFGLGMILCATLGACGGGGPGDDGGDDGTTPDGNNTTGDLQPPEHGFQLRSPDITLQPNEEVTKCWYFAAPNTANIGVTRWESKMSPGSHHMIVFLSNTQQQAPGTVTENCGIIGAGTSGAVWSYSSQTPYADQQLPLDDGTGKPVGVGLVPNQPGFIQMHYLNASDEPITVHVTLNVHTHAEGVTYTRASPYITFHNEISIPPMSDGSFGGSCQISSTANFYQLGTHAHKQATHMQVKNGTEMVFQTDSWSEPGGREWLETPFYKFSSGRLDYRCDYYNPTNRTITTGDSAATDEMCMAVGYMFPATGPILCVHYQGQDIILTP